MDSQKQPARGAMPGVRRAFTLPTKLSGEKEQSDNQGEENTLQQIETLFVHSSARIINFNTATHSKALPKSRESGKGNPILGDEDPGTLPWRTTTERLVASGPLRIYRVPGSVAFLNAGSFLKPVLAKSQCWCVDGETKFVLKRGLHDFYRIELPNESVGDKQVAEDFGMALDQILRFEKTPCPFKREFIVDLPESPQVTYVPWKPKHRPVSPIRWENSAPTDQSPGGSKHRSAIHPILSPGNDTKILDESVDNGLVNAPMELQEYTLISSDNNDPRRSIKPKIGRFERLDKYHRRDIIWTENRALSENAQRSMSDSDRSFGAIENTVVSDAYSRMDVKDTADRNQFLVSREAQNLPLCKEGVELSDKKISLDQTVLSHRFIEEPSRKTNAQNYTAVQSIKDKPEDDHRLTSSPERNEVLAKSLSDFTETIQSSTKEAESAKGFPNLEPNRQAMHCPRDQFESNGEATLLENGNEETFTQNERTQGAETAIREKPKGKPNKMDYGNSLPSAAESDVHWAYISQSNTPTHLAHTSSISSYSDLERKTADPRSVISHRTKTTSPDSRKSSTGSCLLSTSDSTDIATNNPFLMQCQDSGPCPSVASQPDVLSKSETTQNVVEASLPSKVDEPDTPPWHSAMESPIAPSISSAHTVGSSQTLFTARSISSSAHYTWEVSHSPQRASKPPIQSYQKKGQPLDQRQQTLSKSPLAFQADFHLPSNRYEHIGAVFGEKMAGVFLGPPLKLAALMLSIATKFTKGVRIRDDFGVGWSRRGEIGRKLPGTWEYYSEEERDFESEFESDWEDQYGIDAYGIDNHDLEK